MTRVPAHRRKRDPYRRQILGVRKPPPPPTCIRCGAPVPEGQAMCAPHRVDCKPRVAKQSKGDGDG